MTSAKAIIDGLDWAGIAAQLDAEGHALLPGLLGPDAARNLARQSASSDANGVALPPNGLGRGELLYFGSALPEPLQTWRSALYRHLAPVANCRNETLGSDGRFPAELMDFLSCNREAGQKQAQSHLSRLGVDDHLCLHQRNDGVHVFPMQLVALLSEADTDFQGGEFVMTEQRPRMQSRPLVLPLKLGDAAIIATAQRPFKGARGHYRVNLWHGISRVRSGERIGLELSFHDAPGRHHHTSSAFLSRHSC